MIPTPALISFSGGRTSAYMLHRILEHSGALPDGAHVLFANTGKERLETLDFVHAVATRWNVPVRWVEWRLEAPFFAEVTHATAARAGEPFRSLIAKKKMPPNWRARFCTEELKVKTMHRMMASLGYPRNSSSYVEVIGLRHDEGPRLMKMYERNDNSPRRCVAPLDQLKVTNADVMEFWRQQPFDLALKPGEGNCDLCFLKAKGLRKELIRQGADWRWWDEQERSVNGFFDRRDSYAGLARLAGHDLFPPALEEEHDVECGLLCQP